MDERRLILSVLGSGAALGLLLGFTTNTAMSPPPEPSWKRLEAQDVPSSAADWQYVDSGPQDLSPQWYLDRMPTWKRREQAERTRLAELPPVIREEEPLFEEAAAPPQAAQLAAAPVQIELPAPTAAAAAAAPVVEAPEPAADTAPEADPAAL